MGNDPSLFNDSETLEVSRKKALLGLLALTVAARENLAASDDEVAAYARGFRERFSLSSDADLEAWFSACGLAADGFARVMLTFATVTKLEQVYSAELDHLAALQRAVWTAHAWHQRSAGE